MMIARWLVVGGVMLGVVWSLPANAAFWRSSKVRLRTSQTVGGLVKLHLQQAGLGSAWDVTSITPQRPQGSTAAWRVEARTPAGQVKRIDLKATIFPEQRRRISMRTLGAGTQLHLLADAVLRADTGQGADAWRVDDKLSSRRAGKWEISASSSPKTWPFLGERTITLELASARP